MKKLALIAILALPLVAGGCTTAQFQADAAAIIAKIKSGAKVVEYEVRQAADLTCGNLLPQANAVAMQITAGLVNADPKTQAKIKAMNLALVGATNSCIAYERGTDAKGLLALALNIWNSYQTGKAAMNAAQAAGGA